MNSFETLITEKGISRYSERWHPHNVDSFKSLVCQGCLKDIDRNVLSNIAYSLQYIQYLQLQIDELNLHSIVQCSLYKTYIITSMSIVEAVFNQALRCSGLWPQTDGWELIKQTKTNEFTDKGDTYRIENNIMIKNTPVEKKMDFNNLINRIKEKGVLNLRSSNFPEIKKLQKLRNRVHLQIAENRMDTDYYKFGKTM